MNLSSWRHGALRAARWLLGVDTVAVLALGFGDIGWGTWLFYDGLRGGPDHDQGFMEMLFVVVGPMVVLSGLGLVAVGFYLARLVRAYDEDRPAAALALLALFGALLVAGSFTNSEGWRLPPSPQPLAAGVLHRACVGFALATGAPIRWRVWRAGRGR